MVLKKINILSTVSINYSFTGLKNSGKFIVAMRTFKTKNIETVEI